MFGVTEVQRGLFPMAGSTVRLRRQIGYAVAAEMLLCGDDLPAKRAYELGLINHVVPDGQALAKAKELAQRIAKNGPLAVKAIVATLRATETLPEEEAFAIEQKHGMAVMASADAQEGPRAFFEKRDRCSGEVAPPGRVKHGRSERAQRTLHSALPSAFAAAFCEASQSIASDRPRMLASRWASAAPMSNSLKARGAGLSSE